MSSLAERMHLRPKLQQVNSFRVFKEVKLSKVDINLTETRAHLVGTYCAVFTFHLLERTHAPFRK